MKTFIVEMDNLKDCAVTCRCCLISQMCCFLTFDDCEGDLNNRPTWCPLREVKKHYKSQNLFYVEAESEPR